MNQTIISTRDSISIFSFSKVLTYSERLSAARASCRVRTSSFSTSRSPGSSKASFGSSGVCEIKLEKLYKAQKNSHKISPCLQKILTHSALKTHLNFCSLSSKFVNILKKHIIITHAPISYNNNKLYDSITLVNLSIFSYTDSSDFEKCSAQTPNLNVNWAIPASPGHVAASQLH